mgnify:CR=1 FL=1
MAGAESPIHTLDAARSVLTVHRIPGIWAMLQRMCICLRAVATAVGIADVSPIAGLVPTARRWLRSRKLSPRDLSAASAGKEWIAGTLVADAGLLLPLSKEKLW